MKNKKIKIILLTIFACVGFGAFIFSGINFDNTKINLNEYIITEIQGFDGYARVNCSLDSERLLNDISKDEKNAVIVLKYKECIDTIKIDIENVEGVNGKLKNKDVIRIVINYDENMFDRYNIDVEKEDFEKVLSDLPKGEKIDIFKNVEVIVAGISPLAYANVQNNWQDSPLSSLKFSLDKSNNIKKNDTIKVTCVTDAEAIYEMGYIPESMSRDYVVKVANSYAESAKDIDEKVLMEVWKQITEAVDRETKDLSFRILYKATGDEKYLYQYNKEEVMSTEFDSAYFLKKKDSTIEGAENYIIMLAKAKITNQSSAIDVYFAFEYRDGSVDDEGIFVIGHNSEDEKYICSNVREKVVQAMLDSRNSTYSIEKLDINFGK